MCHCGHRRRRSPGRSCPASSPSAFLDCWLIEHPVSLILCPIPGAIARSIWVATIAGAAYGLVTIGMFLWHPSNSPLKSGASWDHVCSAVVDPSLHIRRDLPRISASPRRPLHRLLAHLRAGLAPSPSPHSIWILNLVAALYEIWPYLDPDIHAGHWGIASRFQFSNRSICRMSSKAGFFCATAGSRPSCSGWRSTSSGTSCSVGSRLLGLVR